MIVTSHHETLPDGGISKVPQGRAVRIGDRAWLGARVMVLPGVTIGDDVVIGAGSVVTKDCLTPGTYVGSPAKESFDDPVHDPVGRRPAFRGAAADRRPRAPSWSSSARVAATGPRAASVGPGRCSSWTSAASCSASDWSCS